MTLHAYQIAMNSLMIVGGVFALYGIYYFIIGALGLRRVKPAPAAKPKTRFALVCAARNEEQVIGHLLDSIAAQNYPKDLFDIYVAPNNCTDDTKGEALRHGAKIFEPTGEIRVKGQVLTQFMDMIMTEERYDAVCTFDADNLVHPDFLQKMNDAYQNGVQVAQGYRDSKNPLDSPMTVCYAVYYWIVNRFFNGGREVVGLSALLTGSGFMVSADMLRRLDGWHTATMTEDYEFTAQCVMAGERVHYVPGAIVYDELPLTFVQSWKQRRRWCTGFVQGMEIYLSNLFRTAFKRRSLAALDLGITFFSPTLQMLSLVSGAASFTMMAYGELRFDFMPLSGTIAMLGGALLLAYIGCCLAAALVVWLMYSRSIKKAGKGILFFAFYLISWVPIGLISLFKKQPKWEPIVHTSSVGLDGLGPRKGLEAPKTTQPTQQVVIVHRKPKPTLAGSVRR